MAAGCPHLRHLNIAWVTDIDDAAVSLLAEHCPLLAHLNAHGCTKLSDATAASLSAHLPKLRALNVGLSRVSDAGLAHLARGACARSLEAVHVGMCPVTAAGLRGLLASAPNLRVLNVGEVKELSDSELEAWMVRAARDRHGCHACGLGRGRRALRSARVACAPRAMLARAALDRL